MVRIRLARGGAKKRPFYNVVVTDKRGGRDGRYIERVGYLNPVAVGGEVPLKLDLERIQYWQSQGAQPSERVNGLIKHFTRHGQEAAPTRGAPPTSQPKRQGAAEQTTTSARHGESEVNESKEASPEDATDPGEAQPEQAAAPDRTQTAEAESGGDEPTPQAEPEQVASEPAEAAESEQAEPESDESEPEQAESGDDGSKAQDEETPADQDTESKE